MSSIQLQNTIKRLRQNDPTMTTLDLRDVNGGRNFAFESGDEIFTEMIDVLSKNTTVETVSIVLRFLSKLTTEEKIVMFRTIGSLPNLKQVRFASSMGFGRPVLGLISKLLKCSAEKNRLESLILQDIQYRLVIHNAARTNGDTSDLDSFLRCLVGLKHLTSFVLQDARREFNLDRLVVHGLARMQWLTKIAINLREIPDGPRLSQRSLAALAAMPKLERLSLRRLSLGPILPPFLQNLVEHPCLEYLMLEQNLIGAACVGALGNLVRQNGTLKGIYLAYNIIPDQLGTTIVDALSQNTSILDFDISANEIGEACCDAFARALRSPALNLEYLNLSQHALPVSGVAQIAEALRENTKLKSLALTEVRMTDESGLALAESLQGNSTLERLNLSDNKLGNKSAHRLAAWLRKNRTIKSLNLASNQIGNPGAMLLADALLVNSTLEQLNLVNNHSLGTVSYDAFEAMMEENLTLQHLWMPTVLPKSTIPSFVRLNKLGRKELMQEMDNAPKWLDAISKCQDDLAALYCLLRANPNAVSWLTARNSNHAQQAC